MKFVRRPLAMIFALAAATVLSACAGSSYMGISLKPGAADPALQQLTQRARSGDKQAQLDLGIAFEGGHGIERDLNKARHLFLLAATDGGRAQWIYLPSPTSGGQGRVVQTGGALATPGLVKAAQRLDSLDASRETP